MKERKNHGITLIALIVTIIIMLIIAGVVIAQLTGENGLITKSSLVKARTEYQSAKEEVDIKLMEIIADCEERGVEYNIDEIYEAIEKDDEKTIEKIFNKESGAVKSGVSDTIVDLSDIVVSVKKYSKYKFVVEETCELKEITTITAGGSVISANTKGTPAGEEVALEEGWGTQGVGYYKTSDGTEVKGLQTVSTVYAISAGNGETIPVPYGFYYVGGNKSTGVIISDNKADKYDGVTDKTTHEYAVNLKGNQFVWIPCTLNEYKKIDTFKTNTNNATYGYNAWNAEWDRQTNSAEETQIAKYGGFYIGRYEAGTSGITFSTGSIAGKITASTNSYGWGWQNTNFTASKVTSGKVEEKANEIPWYHADYPTAVKMSKAMYSTDYVNSGLVTGTQWDMMIKYMSTDKTSYTDMKSTSWGNYLNTSLGTTDNDPNKVLRGKHAAVDANGNLTEAWTDSASTYKTTANARTLLTTGSTNTVQKMHLYDVAGNLWEWTQEAAYLNSGNTTYYGKNSDWDTYLLRGGSFSYDFAAYPACFRVSGYSACTHTGFGFRVALYIK